MSEPPMNGEPLSGDPLAHRSEAAVYPARDRYAEPGEAAGYDARRFRSLKGRFVDRRERELLGRALAHALASAELRRFDRVLDLPAGSGRLASFLGTRARSVLAADRSREMLRQGAGYEGAAIQADAVELPFADHAFDAVVSLRLLGHLPPGVRRAVLAEMRRVSRRFLIIAFYDSTWLTRLRRRLGPPARRGPWFAEPLAATRRELAELGLRVRLALPLWRWLSETWVFLLERVDVETGARGHQAGSRR